jgi:hypothetical protein
MIFHTFPAVPSEPCAGDFKTTARRLDLVQVITPSDFSMAVYSAAPEPLLFERQDASAARAKARSADL